MAQFDFLDPIDDGTQDEATSETPQEQKNPAKQCRSGDNYDAYDYYLMDLDSYERG